MNDRNKEGAAGGLSLEDIIEEAHSGKTAVATGNQALDQMLRSRRQEQGEASFRSAQTAPRAYTAQEQDLFAPAFQRVSANDDYQQFSAAAEEPWEDIAMPQKKANKTQKKKKTVRGAARAKKIAAVLAVAAVLLTGSAFAYTYLYPSIHFGVRAGAVGVGGLEVALAKEKIDGAADTLLSGKMVTLSIYEKEYDIDIDAVTSGLDSARSAQAAFDYTHAGGAFSRVANAVGALFGGHEVPLSVSVDDKTLTARLDEVEAEALTEPVQPSWKLEEDHLVVDTGTPGVGFDTNAVAETVTEKIRTMDFAPLKVDITTRDPEKVDIAAIHEQAQSQAQSATVDKKDGKTIIPSVDGVQFDLEDAKAIVGDGTKQTYSIPVTRTAAEITAEKLAEVLFSDTLASATTKFNTGNKPRTNNVNLACEHINGTILNPGDEFAYNAVVGERTAARGFRSAGAYANGRVVDEVGGGVCQPSSTIYMAVLRADLEVTERHNHSFTVAYTPLGEDATVSWGGPDFRFKNDTKYPIKVLASASGGSMTITLKGTKVSDKKVTLKTEVLSTLDFETIEKADKSLKPGVRSTSQTGTTGYKTVTYKTITENGQTKTVRANKSSYKKRDKIILVGPAAPVETPPSKPAPEKQPAPTQTNDPEAA